MKFDVVVHTQSELELSFITNWIAERSREGAILTGDSVSRVQYTAQIPGVASSIRFPSGSRT